MKKQWNKPVSEEINFSATEQGTNFNTKPDEIRVDQNGNYWIGAGSGADSKPDLDGEAEVL